MPFQHEVDAPVAEAPPFAGNLLHSFTQIPIVRPDAPVSNARPVDLQYSTRPALAHPVRCAKVGRLARGLYDYPKIHLKLGLLSPAPDDVARALARETGSRAQIAGTHATNALILWRLRKENIEVFPVSSYTHTITLTAAGDGTEVSWRAVFFRADTTNEPDERFNDEAAVAAMEAFVGNGLAGLEKLIDANRN